MELETVERHGYIHVIKNGVESTLSVAQIEGGAWAIFTHAIAYTRKTRAEALAWCADQMGTWYTAVEAAERLVELGAFNKPPSARDVCMWARHGFLPGARKITGKGGWGQGGSWRIPEAALAEFAKGRRER